MSKHRHAEMIKAKADNMELVVFIKCQHEWKVQDCNDDQLNFSCGHDYFMCLPQHKEACLHWLNGGEADENNSGKWDNIEPHQWSEQSMFMHDAGYDIRIKPRKEKRWISVHGGNEQLLGGRPVTVCSHAYHNKSDAEAHGGQVVELEIEVTK